MGVTLLLLTIASEALSLMRAQRLKPLIPLMEVSGIKAMQQRYEQLGALAPFGLGKVNVSTLLASRLVALADRPIVAYRDASVNKTEWEQALDALDFASTVKPSSSEVASRRAYVQGQLARSTKRSREAITLFRESARLDPRSFDPYLGLATVFTYDMHDLNGLTQAVADAVARGYKQGGRERVEFGDLYRVLGEEERSDASRLSGTEKTELLERAAGDYTKCVEYLDGVRLFNSEANLRTCRKRLAEVQAQLPPPPEPSLTDDVLGVVGRVIKEKIQHSGDNPK